MRSRRLQGVVNVESVLLWNGLSRESFKVLVESVISVHPQDYDF